MAQEIAIREMPLSDMWRLAESIAKSRLFGIQTPDQALVLMSIAQAEGQHPAIAARDYDIIQGRPAKKAEAMLRDFLANGGKVEWHALEDTLAEATFAHPHGGIVKIRWDLERARQAGLASKDMYKKFPRQMLRSRVVSEGVRTVFPAATSGMYVPEEVREFGPQRAEPKDITPKADLDAFAAEELPRPSPTASEGVERLDGQRSGGASSSNAVLPPGNPADPRVSPEEPPDPILVGAAQNAAAKGTALFRHWLQGLDARDRAALKPLLGTRTKPGELTLAAQKADDNPDDPFGLPPITKPDPVPSTHDEKGEHAQADLADQNQETPDREDPPMTERERMQDELRRQQLREMGA